MSSANEHPLPARIMHWIHLISMIVLVFTGFYIHSPFFAGSMGLMRMLHFISMYILVFNLIARVYWAFMGSDRDYREFLWSRKNRGKFWPIIAYYLFLKKQHPVTGKYNPLQKMTYCLWVILIIAQAYTGFALYWPQAAFYGGFIELVGGLFAVRMIHYLIMWLFILTSGIHLYLVFAEDLVQLPYMLFGIRPKGSKH